MSPERDSPNEPSDETLEGNPSEQPSLQKTPTNVMNNDTLEDSARIHMMSDDREEGITPSSSRSHTHQTEVSDDGAIKKIVEIVEGRFIGGHASHEITNHIKSFFPGAYPSWKEVPNDKRDIIFDKFKEDFTWRGVSDAQVRNIWNDVAKHSYSRLLFYARKDAKGKCRDHTYTGARNHRPKFIKTPIWHELIDKHWNTEKFTKKCDIASKNRRTEKDGKIPTHTGGSVNFVTVWKNMEKEKKRPVSRCEVYLRTHKKKKGTEEFVDKAAELVYEKYMELVTQVHGESVANDITFYDNDLWKEAAGGEKRGKVYGQISPYDFGTRRGNFLSGGSSTCSSSQQENEAWEERVRDEMKKEMEDKLDEQRKLFEEKMKEQEERLKEQEERLKEREDKIQEEQEHMKKQMYKIMRAINGRKK